MLVGDPSVRTGHLLLALAGEDDPRGWLIDLSEHFDRIDAAALRRQFAAITAGSPEAGQPAQDGTGAPPPAAPGAPSSPGASQGQGVLDAFTDDLTARARDGKIDPVTGRDAEVRQIVDILMRRRQNNPLLAGEAGVGKTALVEGFALKIAAGDVPAPLRDVSLRALDVARLQAGAGVKGEFEKRLRQLIEEVQASPRPVILFIDEAHTLVGAGGAQGTGDAANLLKPALARGTLRTIAATTWAEYKQHIEKDPALTRRFQVVKVEEPDVDRAVAMMRHARAALEKHHKVRVTDDAVAAAVKLSHRYIAGRQLPDKCMSLLDTACARVAVSQQATPGAVEDLAKAIGNDRAELAALEAEAALGADHAKRLADLKKTIDDREGRLASLRARWESELALLRQIDEATREAESSKAAPTPVARLAELRARLAEAQGDSPLVFPLADASAVASVVGDWTGIPVGRMATSEISAVLNLAPTLRRRVIGQDHALDLIAAGLQVSSAKLANPQKPVGVFLLVGPSGTGKTETAKALAEAMYGGADAMITVNMTELSEKHNVSKLIGSPKGYVGYGEGGMLTEAVRRRPYSVVLLDEFEKAAPEVHRLFFSVFDEGTLTDAEGTTVDFRSTIVLMTSNVGSAEVMDACRDPDVPPDPATLAARIRPALRAAFPDALLGRMTVVPYYPINDAMLRSIIELQLSRIASRTRDSYGAAFTHDPGVTQLIASRCTEAETGARAVDAIISRSMLPDLSRSVLDHVLAGRAVSSVHVGVDGPRFTYAIA
jgi:type VI secretion system protein VasG